MPPPSGPRSTSTARPNQVLVEQLGAIDASRLGALSGHLTAEELWGIDEALITLLGLR